jgi:hypothetical protein
LSISERKISKKLTGLKEFPREIPDGFSNGFKRTRNLPLGSFLRTCLPVVKTWYIPEWRKCYTDYFGIGRLKERVRIYQKKLKRRFFGNELLKKHLTNKDQRILNIFCDEV